MGRFDPVPFFKLWNEVLDTGYDGKPIIRVIGIKIGGYQFLWSWTIGLRPAAEPMTADEIEHLKKLDEVVEPLDLSNGIGPALAELDAAALVR